MTGVCCFRLPVQAPSAGSCRSLTSASPSPGVVPPREAVFLRDPAAAVHRSGAAGCRGRDQQTDGQVRRQVSRQPAVRAALRCVYVGGGDYSSTVLATRGCCIDISALRIPAIMCRFRWK